MHAIIEKARKAAGISGMVKNYPDNHKQRGAGYWAAFLGAIGVELGRLDQELLAAKSRIADLSELNTRLEHKLSQVRDDKGRALVTNWALQDGWSSETRLERQGLLTG